MSHIDPKKTAAYRMLLLIREHKEVSVDELVDMIGTTRKHVHNIKHRLIKRGLIYPYMNGVYRCTEEGKTP